MVALPSSTVAASTQSMAAWAGWTLVILTGLVLAHANPERRFSGDVSNDEVLIDKLLWNSGRHASHRQQQVASSAPTRLRHPDTNDKIDFAVTPQDQRYYHPPSPSRHQSPPPETDLLHFLSPDLTLQPQHLDYPEDLLQYQDEEDIQYPAEYATQFRPQYRPQERHRPSYLNSQDLPYPRGLFPAGLQDPRLLREEDEEEEEDVGGEEMDDARDVPRKELVDRSEFMGDGQLLMKKGSADTEEDEEEEREEREQKEVKADNVDEKASPKTTSKTATSQPETMNYMHLRRAPAANHETSYTIHQAPQQERAKPANLSDVYFTAVLAGCTAVAVCAVVGAGICWYRLNKSHSAARDAEYPAYGVTGPNKDLSPSGDRKLAQYAHMYHYQQKKEQMIALEKSSGGERHGSTSDVDSEEDGEENEYTVYECPGLAPTGEMEVKNPLFHDDPTPATPSIRKEAEQDHEDKTTK